MIKAVSARPSFQGDLMVRKILCLPDGLIAAAPENGVHIVAHSETGHHHVVASRAAQLLTDETNAFIAYLQVGEQCELTHLREFDRHEPLGLLPGLYEIRRGREFGPEGWRQSAD